MQKGIRKVVPKQGTGDQGEDCPHLSRFHRIKEYVGKWFDSVCAFQGDVTGDWRVAGDAGGPFPLGGRQGDVGGVG